MTHPCENCKTRKFFAKRFDMHFYGEDCWYECEKYERWKEQKNDTDSADSEIHDGRGQHHSDGCAPLVWVYAARREDLGFEAGRIPDHEDDGMQQKQTR